MALKQYPTGSIVSFATTHPDSTPSGWVLCDGRELNRSTYGNLFSVISDTYGAGDGSSTFNVPNLQEWFVKSVTTSIMSSGAGTTVGASTYFQGAQFSYNFGITVAQAEYQTGIQGTPVSSTQSAGSFTSSSAGDHSHSYQVTTDSVDWGRGVRDGDDNMIPKNQYAQQGRIYDNNSGRFLNGDWYQYHHSGNQAGSWQQHELHSHSHANASGVWTHTCSQLESSAGSTQKCQSGVPICTTQQIIISQTQSTGGTVPFGATLNANHKHIICTEYQVQEGPSVISNGEFSYSANYSSKRLFSTVSNHNHGGVSINEQSGITHGQTEHSFSNTLTADFGVAAGYPGAGTQNSSGDLKPAAVVVGYLIKT